MSMIKRLNNLFIKAWDDDFRNLLLHFSERSRWVMLGFAKILFFALTVLTLIAKSLQECGKAGSPVNIVEWKLFKSNQNLFQCFSTSECCLNTCFGNFCLICITGLCSFTNAIPNVFSRFISCLLGWINLLANPLFLKFSTDSLKK